MTVKQSFDTLELPASCQTLDFIADTHLHAAHPQTFLAWQHYMQTTPADTIFILGDLFEVWVGDDLLKAPSPLGDFERQCIDVIAQTAQKKPVYFMHGNRDFALQKQAAKRAGMQLLHDPCIIKWQQHHAIITHGDLLCTDDIKYQRYRKIMHNPLFQHIALLNSLKTRMAAGQKIRQKSEASKKNSHAAIMDVNQQEVINWFNNTSGTPTLIHGHTHRPADHTVSETCKRIVLSDWDLDDAAHPRAEVLRWQANTGFQRIPAKNVSKP